MTEDEARRKMKHRQTDWYMLIDLWLTLAMCAAVAVFGGAAVLVIAFWIAC